MSFFLSWSVDEGVDPAPGNLRPGDVIGGHELLSYLGGGGMGIVYRARDPGGREVALKLSHRDPQLEQRLQREGELIAALRHPAIVRVHSAGEDEGWTYIVCELVEGARGLDELISSEPREALLDHLATAAEAIGHAHSRGIIHRDVKAANLLVDASGRLVVTDFGLGRSERSAALTQSGAQIGTPHAMSPEQFVARPASPASDVWSLGILLYQILSGGRLPFPGPSLQELVAQVLSGRRIPPSAHAACPPALEALCLQCLRVEPTERPVDGDAFAEALATARRAPSASPARSATPLVALLALALLVAVVGLGFVVTRLPRGGSTSTPAASPPALSAVKRALLGLRGGSLTRADLARVVSASPQDPALGEAHLVLATSPGGGRLAWERRLAHALAAERAGAPSGAVVAAQADALERLRRGLEAAEVWRARANRTQAKADWLACAWSLLRGSDARGALDLLAAHDLHSPAALRLRFACEVELVRPSAARATLAQSRAAAPASPTTRLLEVLVASWSATDRLAPFHAALRTHPDSPLVQVELARHYLGRGQLAAAEGVLDVQASAPQSPGAAEAQRLRRQLQSIHACLERGSLAELDPEVYPAAAVCLLREGLIGLSRLRRTFDQLLYHDPDSLTRSARRVAIARHLKLAHRLGLHASLRWSLHAAQAEASPPASEARWVEAQAALRELQSDALRRLDVEPRWVARSPLPFPERSLSTWRTEWPIQLVAEAGVASSTPERRRAALRQVDAFVARESIVNPQLRLLHLTLLALTDQGKRAAAELDRVNQTPALWGTFRWQDDPQVTRLQIQLRQRLGLDPALWRAHEIAISRRGSEASERALVDVLRGPRGARRRGIEQILTADPLYTNAILLLSGEQYEAHPVPGLRSACAAVDRDPRYLDILLTQLRVNRLRFPTAPDAFGTDRVARLCEATLIVAKAELGRATDADLERGRAALGQALAQDPSAPTPRLLRTFLHLRLGRGRQARRDLALATEDVPNVAYAIFMRALSDAAQGDSASDVFRRLDQAGAAKYDTVLYVVDHLDRYPELRRFAGSPHPARLAAAQRARIRAVRTAGPR